MPAIRTRQGILALTGRSQLALERNSSTLSAPDERGSSSLPMKFPQGGENDRLLDFPNRFDHRAGEPLQVLDATALDDDGSVIADGILRYRGCEAGDYLYNLEFGASAAMASST